MTGKRFRILLIIILAVSLFVSYSVYLFQKEMTVERLPVLGQVQDFRLFDESGKEFTLRDLAGKIWIANFFFTTCGDICPMMTKNMAALHRSFELVGDVTHVSITVNPEYDSSSVLRQYAQKYKANTRKWHFLTGPRAMITELAVGSFKIGSIEEPVFHSSKFALVDGDGRIRGYYDGVQSGEVSELFRDVALLLKER